MAMILCFVLCACHSTLYSCTVQASNNAVCSCTHWPWYFTLLYTLDMMLCAPVHFGHDTLHSCTCCVLLYTLAMILYTHVHASHDVVYFCTHWTYRTLLYMLAMMLWAPVQLIGPKNKLSLLWRSQADELCAVGQPSKGLQNNPECSFLVPCL